MAAPAARPLRLPRPMTELPKTYEPQAIEAATMRRWLETKAFAAAPDARRQRYVIMMPLPNVTGALHMGHAMDNVMQDLLTRWHRMQGDNTLWMAGTDHAGIATQAVVEKRLKELEGKTRHDLGRDGLIRRIWEWKDQYQQRIVRQQQAMGCSCDWDRARFTMDPVCARAVRHAFFRLFRDGLIFQGSRLVNWDCDLQTAVADDELYRATVQGHFYYLRYPVIDPQPGEPTHVTVATTRPETMLGDTAVAVHPDPRGVLSEAIAATKRALDEDPNCQGAGRADAEAELDRLLRREFEVLPTLEKLATMARAGRKVRLPLADRAIPLIVDEWAKPDMGSGCVKITPAHDPNDYAVWQRHRAEFGAIRILEANGTLNNEVPPPFRGLDRFAARTAVVDALRGQGLLERIEDREIEVDHSDRSKSIIEPLLSKQWFVHMADVDGGVVLGRGTRNEHRAPGLAQAAIDAASPTYRSPTDRRVSFHPDGDRYSKVYLSWLSEKRDWCISRQLWWGHRIPVWRGSVPRQNLLNLESLLQAQEERDDICAFVVLPDGTRLAPLDAIARLKADSGITEADVLVCLRDEASESTLGPALAAFGLQQDPDVLDTWFSSALWPHSTLGWPDPETARLDGGQSPLGASDGNDSALAYYYPGSCLVTGRDILTLWVARMVVMGLYNLGDVPFTDVFLHANIQDGKGERMSKSKGNGIDPVDIIDKYGADAMRYVLCEMQTGTQDIRLPVQAISPYTGNLVDLATAKHGRTIFTYLDPEAGKEFDVLGTMPDVPAAKLVSERFEVGRALCNKLWNAARFALMNLEGADAAASHEPLDLARLDLEDRWILSRLRAAVAAVQDGLAAYNPSVAVGAARDFFWNELCDWYLEMVKPRMRDPARAAVAKQVLAATLDQVLRLLHPFVPFITEALWQRLGELVPVRGIDRPFAEAELLVHAPWPKVRREWHAAEVEAQVSLAQQVVAALREVRARYATPPSQRVPVRLRAGETTRAALAPCLDLVAHMAGAASVEYVDADAARPKDAATTHVGDVEAWVVGVVDVDKERAKLGKELDKLRGQIKGLESKLGNDGFVAKAPAEVVARERTNLDRARAQLTAIETSLRAL
ncbi:MAG: valine--tRNA ligase [Planctomycetota bacterium]